MLQNAMKDQYIAQMTPNNFGRQEAIEVIEQKYNSIPIDEREQNSECGYWLETLELLGFYDYLDYDWQFIQSTSYNVTSLCHAIRRQINYFLEDA